MILLDCIGVVDLDGKRNIKDRFGTTLADNDLVGLKG